MIMKVNHTRKFAHSHMRAMLCVMALIGALTQMVIQAKAIVFFLLFFPLLFGVSGKDDGSRPRQSSPCYVTPSYLVLFA